MRRANETDRDAVLAYLKKGLQDCVYLYIDILNYGISSENMVVWIDEGEVGISLVIMKYYDSFQVYSHELYCDMSPVTKLLGEHPVAMVSGRKDLIEGLEKLCGSYKATYGSVFTMECRRKMGNSASILLATEGDTEEIAALICSDNELGGHYTINVLAAQLRERIRTGTGRSYIIRENGKLVAHTATYAEAENVAVVSGTIVHPEYRGTPYYMLLSNYILERLDTENKKVYTFAISEKMIRYHKTMHTLCGEYGKLVRLER